MRSRARAAAAFFDRYGNAMTPRLSGEQHTRVESIMHIVDTITGW